MNIHCKSNQSKETQKENKLEYLTFKTIGFASSQSIRTKSTVYMTNSCRQGVQVLAASTIMKYISSLIHISNTKQIKADNISLSSQVIGKTKGGYSVKNCKLYDRIKGECTCDLILRVKSLPEVWSKPFSSKNGFLDDDTAIIKASGTSSSKYTSIPRKRLLCIDSTRNNAVSNLAFQLAKKQNITKLDFKTKVPYTRVEDCKSQSKNWSTCSCRVMMYKKGLKSMLQKAIK